MVGAVFTKDAITYEVDFYLEPAANGYAVVKSVLRRQAGEPVDVVLKLELENDDVMSVTNDYIKSKSEAGGENYPILGQMANFSGLMKSLHLDEGNYVTSANFKAGDDFYTIEYHVDWRAGAFYVEREVLVKKNGEPMNKVLFEAE